ncbi:aminoglycoside phosphotransferase family protein [Streptomyces sp. NPDC088923]|uniref:aminoglycoside phosphotransferase family protein n=1 Tax=Streptomyces sp. NPDC088923 TaxID=3365913 RepID=UPI00380BD33A
MVLEPPRRLVRALAEDPGADDAAAWLDRLPELAEVAAHHHGVRVERLLQPGGRSGVILLVRRADGTPAVLKLAPPHARPAAEAAALARWGGLGACRLLAAPAAGTEDGAEEGAGHDAAPEDLTRCGATALASERGLLLERLRPEISLSSLPQAKAMLEAAETVRRLWVPVADESPYETLAARTERQAARMRETAGPLVLPLVENALAVRRDLLGDATRPDAERVLLHGAFRQAKVLAGERLPWLAVGPEPVIGERAYDVARLARDRLEDLVASDGGASTARRRVAKLADALDLDRDRVQGWSHFRATAAGVAALAAGRRQEGETLLEFAAWL